MFKKFSLVLALIMIFSFIPSHTKSAIAYYNDDGRFITYQFTNYQNRLFLRVELWGGEVAYDMIS
ncbi:MAG: hypothetical protein FWE47_03660, partial [Oscillospiraceae bacterium]|nr:hypothetical protein [Oscillospiraceae bacterium]